MSVRGGVRSSRRVAVPVFSYARSAEGLSTIAVANSQSPIANSQETIGSGKATISAPTGMQLSFFQLDDPVLEQIRDEVKTLDINNLTPLEALNKLNEIKKLVGGK